MNTIKITLAALAIAASATSAFAFDNTSGHSDRITTEIPSATATYQTVAPTTVLVAPSTIDTQVDFNRAHINGRAS